MLRLSREIPLLWSPYKNSVEVGELKRKDWGGDIVVCQGVAIYRGRVGDNRLHSHWASQLTIALGSELIFETRAGRQRGQAVYFSSKTAHRLESGVVCSIYFDPLAASIRDSFEDKVVDGWAALALDSLPGWLSNIGPDTDLRALVESTSLLRPSQTTGPRFARVIAEIREQLSSGRDIDRDALAAIVGLSPTRFSHWFVECSGVPLRSYKKWFKLRLAVDAVLAGQPPMDAAMQAGFSDLAHMSRAFAQSFGFTYTDAMRAMAQSTLV